MIQSGLLLPNVLSPDLSNLFLVVVCIGLLLWIVRILRSVCSLTELSVASHNDMVLYIEEYSVGEVQQGLLRREAIEQKLQQKQSNRFNFQTLDRISIPVRFHKDTVQISSSFDDEEEVHHSSFERHGRRSEDLESPKSSSLIIDGSSSSSSSSDVEEISEREGEKSRLVRESEKVEESMVEGDGIAIQIENEDIQQQDEAEQKRQFSKVNLSFKVSYDCERACHMVVFWGVSCSLKNLVQFVQNSTDDFKDQNITEALSDHPSDGLNSLFSSRRNRPFVGHLQPFLLEEGMKGAFSLPEGEEINASNELFQPEKGPMFEPAFHVESKSSIFNSIKSSVLRLFRRRGAEKDSPVDYELAQMSRTINYEVAVLAWPTLVPDSDPNTSCVALGMKLGLSQDAVHIKSSTQIVCSSHNFFELKDVFGMDSVESPECVVCLSEPKNVILLPCNHFITCNNCLEHLEKCPLCRCKIKSFVRFSQP